MKFPKLTIIWMVNASIIFLYNFIAHYRRYSIGVLFWTITRLRYLDVYVFYLFHFISIFDFILFFVFLQDFK